MNFHPPLALWRLNLDELALSWVQCQLNPDPSDQMTESKTVHNKGDLSPSQSQAPAWALCVSPSQRPKPLQRRRRLQLPSFSRPIQRCPAANVDAVYVRP
jgi:hypothetical protein